MPLTLSDMRRGVSDRREFPNGRKHRDRVSNEKRCQHGERDRVLTISDGEGDRELVRR